MFTDTIYVVVCTHSAIARGNFVYTEIIVYRLVGDIKKGIFYHNS